VYGRGIGERNAKAAKQEDTADTGRQIQEGERTDLGPEITLQL